MGQCDGDAWLVPEAFRMVLKCFIQDDLPGRESQ